jgi:hypothetical protein
MAMLAIAARRAVCSRDLNFFRVADSPTLSANGGRAVFVYSIGGGGNYEGSDILLVVRDCGRTKAGV